MPEIKNHFFAGKMNKDLDSRLVPNGEYVDAMNIQVSTSEGSDSGTVRNVMGNKLVSDVGFANSVCVGSIADEINKKIYYILTGGGGSRSAIVEYDIDNNSTNPVLIDLDNSVLELSKNQLITGINIIDDMLFWTDNNSEPKKINIQRSKEGSTDYNTDTTFKNLETNSTTQLLKEHITVIKKAPALTPTVVLESDRDPNNTYTGVMRITNQDTNTWTNNNSSFNAFGGNGLDSRNNFYGLNVGESFTTLVETDLAGNTGFSLDWSPGDTVYLKAFEDGIAPPVPIVNPTIKAVIQSTHFRSNSGLAEYLRNTDFSIPSVNGNKPKNWLFEDPNILYNFADSKIEVLNCSNKAWVMLDSNTASEIVHGEEYDFTFEISNVNNGKAALVVALENQNNSNFTDYWRTNYYDTAGTYTETITLDTASRAGSISSSNYWSSKEQKPFLRFITNNPNLIAPYSVNTAEGQSTDVSISSFANGDCWEIQANNSIAFHAQHVNNGDIGNSHKENVRFFNAQVNPLATNETHSITMQVGIVDISTIPANFEGYIGLRFAGNPAASNTADQTGAWGSNDIYKSRVYTHMSTTDFDDINDWGGDYNNQVLPATGSIINLPFGLNVTAPFLMSPEFTFDLNTPNNWNSSEAGKLDIEIVSTNGVKISDTDIRCVISVDVNGNNNSVEMDVNSVSLENTSTVDARVKLKVSSIGGIPTQVPSGSTELKYAIDKYDDEERLFESKFPRFATRYQYQDGEYSAFSPFSQPAFIPGTFDYHPKKGYNLGMRNKLKQVVLKNINANIPDGVVSVDVLYKEDGSTTVYAVETLKSDKWADDYVIKREAITRAIPSNQLLRPWDNVPRAALAQDVVGGRITYGNYLHQYNLQNNGSEYFPNIDFGFTSNNTGQVSKSVKSLREYQLGIVFVDEYGRETPVISNKNISSKIRKEDANKVNVASVSFKDTKYADNMSYFKFFIKQTSGEYYNMAMDRYWDAGDDHVWVSFPSSDRNKIDIDSFLVLKKGIETNAVVASVARYKVVAIENEAPDYIKTKQSLIERKTHVYNGGNNVTDVFSDSLDNAPLVGKRSFEMRYQPFQNSSGSRLHDIKETLYVEFTDQLEGLVSERYRVASVTTNYKGFASQDGVGVGEAVYSFTLDRPLGDEVEFMATSTKIKDTTKVRIYRYAVENSPQFDGRFFVKIVNDATFASNINTSTPTTPSYRAVVSKKLYYMAEEDQHLARHDSSATGHGGPGQRYNYLLGKFACYFRNYNYGNDDDNSATSRYRFGPSSDNDWKDEYDYMIDDQVDYDGSLHREADRHSVDDSVWFIDEGHFKGSRADFNLNWNYISTPNGDNGGITLNTPSTFSTINLAIGGIYDDYEPNSNATNAQDFFDIGKEGGNPFYQDTATKKLVNQLEPAKQLRFRDDPNSVVYTVQPGVNYEQLLRHNQGFNSSSAWSHDSTEHARFSHNFTRNWRLRVANPESSSPGVLTWDPTNQGTLGPIPGGLILTINHSSIAPVVQTTNGYPQIELHVDSLEASDASGAKHDIKVGMILTSHSNGGASDTLTGATDALDYLAVWKISESGSVYKIHLTGYSKTIISNGSGAIGHNISSNPPTTGGELTFKQPAMNGYSENSANRINLNDPNGLGTDLDNPGLYAVGYTIEFVEPIEEELELPSNPAIWETEPKEDVGLDIYYEASGLNPIEWTPFTKDIIAPTGSIVTKVGNNTIAAGTTVVSTTFSGNIVLSQSVLTGVGFVEIGDELRVLRTDGSSIDLTITALVNVDANNNANTFTINTSLYSSQTTYNLNWHNCYSFGNGVESNRIGDTFNLPFIANGVRVSTTLEEGEYKEERRKYGLIYSGVYNSISGVNNLNQFVQAEKITKDINPIYGSIQKLHQRDSDLIVLCENKILKMLASKDAIFNADSNPQLIATDRVLGQVVPFIGEYGISKNPESFASESYRVYFTDKVRGVVMRLSKDGLTPISNHGMKDWFKDNLKLNNVLIGSYDDSEDEYNVTLKYSVEDYNSKTVSFKEDVKGWASFKSFVPENAISCNNDYYTFFNSKMWKHHVEEAERASFYNGENGCSLSFVMNEAPNTIKTFSTLNYEGTQAQKPAVGFVDEINGWFVDTVQTNKQQGTLLEFIEKEGKWFGYISGDDKSKISDIGSFHVKGIGQAESISNNVITYSIPINNLLTTSDINIGDSIGVNGYVDVEVEKVDITGQTSGKYFWFNQEKMEISKFNGKPYSSGVVVKMLKDVSGVQHEVEVKLFKNNGRLAQDSDTGVPLAYGRFSNALNNPVLHNSPGDGAGDWSIGDILFANKIPSTIGVVQGMSNDRKEITLENNVYSTPQNEVAISYVENTDLTATQQDQTTEGKYFWFNQQDMQDSVFGGDSYSSGKVVTVTRKRNGVEEQVEVKLFKDNGAYFKEDASGNRYAYGRKNNGSGSGDWQLTDVVFGETGVIEVNTSRAPIYTYCQKNQYIENSGLIGYYATINLENKSTDKAELFSFGSNITKSS